jgi:hypothetical protein
MLLQLASADCRIRIMATPVESLYPLHSGRVQHNVIAAVAPLEECADGGIAAQPTSIRLGWRMAWQRKWPRVAHWTRRKDAQTQSACGHGAKSVPAPARRCTWTRRGPRLGEKLGAEMRREPQYPPQRCGKSDDEYR